MDKKPTNVKIINFLYNVDAGEVMGLGDDSHVYVLQETPEEGLYSTEKFWWYVKQ